MQIILFTLGIIISSWAFVGLLKHNDILMGGLPGLSLILNSLFGWDLAITQWAVGIPILFLGLWLLGKQATINATAGAFLLPAAIGFWEALPEARVQCENFLIAAVFGGFIIGIGLGLIFKVNASTGGFSLIARILNKFTGISVSKAMMLIDMTLLTTVIAFKGFEAGALAIIAVVAMGKGIDIIQTGLGRAKSVTIITSEAEEMKRVLYERVNCGITIVKGEGGHSGEQKTMLICVIPVIKLARLKRNVEHVDSEAFTIITDAVEVMGYGFS